MKRQASSMIDTDARLASLLRTLASWIHYNGAIALIAVYCSSMYICVCVYVKHIYMHTYTTYHALHQWCWCSLALACGQRAEDVSAHVRRGGKYCMYGDGLRQKRSLLMSEAFNKSPELLLFPGLSVCLKSELAQARRITDRRRIVRNSNSQRRSTFTLYVTYIHTYVTLYNVHFYLYIVKGRIYGPARPTSEDVVVKLKVNTELTRTC